MMIEHVPNLVTLLRMISILPLIAFLHFHYFQSAFFVFLLAGASDGLDGYLARRYNCQSQLGSFLDPLSDKLLLIICFVALFCLGKIPSWLLQIVLLRDLAIILGAFAYYQAMDAIDFIPSLISKLNTALQIMLLAFLFIELAYAPLPVLFIQGLIMAVTLTTVTSLVHYVWVWGSKTLRR